MLGFVEMALAAEKHDTMAQQGIADRSYRLGRQIAGQPYTMDFRPDRWRDRADIEGDVAGAIRTRRGGRFVHGLDSWLGMAATIVIEPLRWPAGSPCPIPRLPL